MKKLLTVSLILFFGFFLNSCAKQEEFIFWEKLKPVIPDQIEGFEKQMEDGDNFPQKVPYWSYVKKVFIRGKDRVAISIMDTNYDQLLLSDFLLTKEVSSDTEINRKIKIGPYAGWEKIKNDKAKGKQTNVLVLLQNRILVRIFATAGVSEEEIQKATIAVDYKMLEGLL